MSRVSRAFQFLLWNSRYVVLLAVVASLVITVVLFVLVTVDTTRLIGEIYKYSNPGLSTVCIKRSVSR